MCSSILTDCSALLNVPLNSSVSNTYVRSSVQHMETRWRSGKPNSSNFPFFLQLGLRVLKEFVANIYILGSPTASYDTQMRSFSKRPIQRSITLLRSLHPSNLQTQRVKTNSKVIFKNSVFDHNSQNLLFLEQVCSSAHLLPLLLLSLFHFIFVNIFSLTYLFNLC